MRRRSVSCPSPTAYMKQRLVRVNIINTPQNAPSGLTEIAKCCICFEAYNKTTRAPISMTCGHTFCRRCVGMLNSDVFFCCCVCRTVTVLGTNSNKNLSLLQLLEKLHLLACDDGEVSSTSTTRNYNHYTKMLQEIEAVTFLKYTKRFIEVTTDYIVLKISAVFFNLRQSVMDWLDETAENMRPHIESILRTFGGQKLIDYLNSDNENEDTPIVENVTPAPAGNSNEAQSVNGVESQEIGTQGFELEC